MAYKDLFKRLITSIIFLSIYLVISTFYFQYIIFLIILIYIFILIEVFLYFNKYKYLIYFYLFISFVSVLTINFDNNSIYHFNLFILTIITFDIFSYLVGKNFGKYKIIKVISPNKTLEGLIGGILFSYFFSIIYCAMFGILINITIVLFITLLIITSFIGDILESFFKRKNNIKNSSNFLPGHGGFFDRFDSFILSIISYSIMNNIL